MLYCCEKICLLSTNFYLGLKQFHNNATRIVNKATILSAAMKSPAKSFDLFPPNLKTELNTKRGWQVAKKHGLLGIRTCGMRNHMQLEPLFLKSQESEKSLFGTELSLHLETRWLAEFFVGY